MKKFSIKNYKLRTPRRWRRLGDSLLATSTFAMTFSILADYKWLAVIFVLIGVLGKFLTNFFRIEDSETGKEKFFEKN